MSNMTPNAYKLLFLGSEGAGKTTAIAALSDFPPIETDVVNPSGTLDFGECSLPDGHKLLLYGAPAQSHFQFLWRIVAHEVVGVVILVDHSRPDPCADLDAYLDAFSDVLKRTVAVVGVGRMPEHAVASMSAYHDVIEDRGLSLPVFAVDVRQREDVLLLIDALFHQIEALTSTPQVNVAAS